METFRKSTFRTIDACLKMIEVRIHNNYAGQAALKGIKIEPKKVRRKFQEMSVDQKEQMQRVIQAAQQRKVLEKSKKLEKKRGIGSK